MGPKRVLVLGASGGTGQQVVALALEKGHVVTAFVRNPREPAVTLERLRTIKGDVVRDDAALGDAMQGQDVVISALGVGKSFKAGGLMAASAPRIVAAMARQGVSRLISVSAFGVGETYRDVPMLPRVFIRTMLRDVYRDKDAGDEVFRRSGLDWTIVYPSGLTDTRANGKYRVGERLALRGFPTIPRADVAAFLVEQIESTAHFKKGVLIST